MRYLKLYEEYRLVKLSKNNYEGRPNVKDPNEPFFIGSKSSYWERLRSQERREQQRQQKVVHDEQQEREYWEQKPMILKYIEIIKNHPEEILKSGYTKQNSVDVYGVIMKGDKKQIISYYYDKKFYYLRINGQTMSKYKEQKGNPDLDPYGEDDWSVDLRPIEVLGNLIKDYVRENELMF